MKGQWKEWQPGQPVTVNRIVWGQPEIDQIQDVLDNDWFGPGPKVDEFAKSISDFTGIDYVQPVNSGSSALELATQAMIHFGHWKPGDWILHPLLTFPTSITPAIRAGLIPYFVDVEMGTYQIDLNEVKEAIRLYGDRIKGAIIPHLLGNVCNIDYLMDILDGRPWIEDCCDTMGSLYKGRHVGQFGKVGALSFYGSHHITTGGVGGALITNSEEIYEFAKSVTHWGRNDYASLSGAYEKFEKRYWYETLGADYQMTELQAAFGIAQAARLKKSNKRRKEVFVAIHRHFLEQGLDNDFYFHLPQYSPSSDIDPSWFGYPVTIKRGSGIDRRDLTTFLIANKIEIRPIFTGNILRHPAFNPRKIKVSGPYANNENYLSVADTIGIRGLFLPAWGMSKKELGYMLGVINRFFEEEYHR